MRWSFVILISLLLFIFTLPLFFTLDPVKTNTNAQLLPLSREHPLGTDFLGRDLLARLVYGGQRTLTITGLAALLAVFIGTPFGLLGGLGNNFYDRLVLLFINVLLSFPGILLAFIIITLLGQGVVSIIIAAGCVQIAPFALVTRGVVKGIRRKPYVESAQAIGVTTIQLIRFTILPNVLPTLLAYAGVTFAYTLLNTSALSFLGLGGETGVPDWGVMLAEGRALLRVSPSAAIIPGVAIAIMVLTINNLVDLTRRD